MIVEIARIKVKHGMHSHIEDALRFLGDAFKRAKGCQGSEMRRSLENHDVYYVQVRWDAVENHMIDFRSSPDGAEWTRLSRPCFDGMPVMDHTELLG